MKPSFPMANRGVEDPLVTVALRFLSMPIRDRVKNRENSLIRVKMYQDRLCAGRFPAGFGSAVHSSNWICPYISHGTGVPVLLKNRKNDRGDRGTRNTGFLPGHAALPPSDHILPGYNNLREVPS